MATRLVQALIAGFAAGLTLLVYPLVVLFVGAAHGGAASGGAMEVSIGLAKLAFSRLGLAFIALSMVAGYLVSPERMASGFSFIWGTHPFWERADNFIRGRLGVGFWTVVLVIVAAFVWWRFR